MKWNEEKTEVTLSKSDYEALQTKADSATDKYNDGYGKGADAGRKEIKKLLEPYGIDLSNLESSLESKFQMLNDIEKGKYPKEITDKFKETEVFKDLQTKLQKAQAELEKTKNDFTDFQKATLVDSKIKTLATENKAINPALVASALKTEYTIKVGEKNEIVVENGNGVQMFNDKGEALGINDVFKTFAEKNKYLFEADGSGGSGGGGEGVPVGVKLSDLKTDKDKSAYIQKHGLEKYQKLVDAEIEAK